MKTQNSISRHPWGVCLILVAILTPLFGAGARGDVPQVLYAYTRYVDSTTTQFVVVVRPNGVGGQVDILYGLTPYLPPYIVTTQGFPADSGVLEVAKVVSGLAPRRLYSYQVAIAGIGSGWGPLQQVNTGINAVSPKFIALTPEPLSPTSLKLSVLCNPRGRSMTLSFNWTINDAGSNYFDGRTPPIAVTDATEDTVISTIIYGLFPATTAYVRSEAVAADSAFLCTGYKVSARMPYDSSARSLSVPITIYQNLGQLGWSKVLNFGLHSDASYCRDAGTGEDFMPPPAPSGWDARFTDSRKGSAACFPDGMDIDIRTYFSPAQVDTYKIRFIGDAPSYPFLFTWPSLESLYSGPVTMRMLADTIDMKAATSVVIDNYDEAPQMVLTIRAEGPRAQAGRPMIMPRQTGSYGLDGAQLTATVNPNGFNTRAWFAWGKSVQYDQSTSPMNIGRESGATALESVLQNLEQGVLYHFRVVTENQYGPYYGQDMLLVAPGTTSVTDPPGGPRVFALRDNYPNPFNPSTTIRYELPVASSVRLTVIDMLGRTVATLVDRMEYAGVRSAVWEAAGCASGVYYCRIEAAAVGDPGRSFMQVKKLLLVR